MLLRKHDESGNIIGLKYNNTQYYYIKNLQGDIIGILDNNLTQVVSYTYDSWGKLISIKDANRNEITDTTNIGLINPYRYRSYRYDAETGLYYLNSRYYNPEWGRFINADGMISTGQGLLAHNMYVYCENNTVNRMDLLGDSWVSILKNATANFVTNIVKKTAEVVNAIAQKNNVVLSSSNNGHGNLPLTGEPNSTVKKPNGDTRAYGPDGRATKDTDYSHPSRHPELKNPHEHDWEWDNNGVPNRGKAHNFENIGVALGTGVGIGFGGYLLYRGIRMIPSLFPALWWTIPANVVAP